MKFEALAVKSMTVRCRVLRSMVSVLQRRQYIALEQKLPTKLHGIKWWSSVCLCRVVQHFLMPQRNVLCLHIQDDWIRLRTMPECLESGFVSMELSCRTLFRIWPIGATEWEAMEIEPRFGHPNHRGSKFFRNCGTHTHHATWHKNSADCHLSNTCHENLKTYTWHYVWKTVVIEWGTDLLWYIGLVTWSVGKDITFFPALVYEMTNIIILVDQDWKGTFLFSKFCVPSYGGNESHILHLDIGTSVGRVIHFLSWAEIFLFATLSRLTVEPTQPPSQWQMKICSPGGKAAQGVNLTSNPYSSCYSTYLIKHLLKWAGIA